MSDVTSITQRKSTNVVFLEDLLAGGSRTFRKAVLEALRLEGFDIGESLPNLQQPMEILAAIEWMGTGGFGERWDTFLSALQDADRTGIFVDLSSPIGGVESESSSTNRSL